MQVGLAEVIELKLVEVPDTRIALVEFAKRDDARRAMQAMLRRPQQLARCLLEMS